MLNKITALNNLIASLADRPNTALNSTELKQYFDSQPDQLKTAINALIDALLSSATGDSGAHNIGSAVIAGVAGDSVYEQLVSLKTAIDNAAVGTIPNGSLTPQKLSFDPGVIAKDAAGTGTAIALTITPFSVYEDNRLITFIASANNSSSATTINVNGLGARPLYKPGTTTAPTLIAGKAYTVWFDATANAFFIKASAEGTAVAGDVLAGKTFSNDSDTGLAGSIPVYTADGSGIIQGGKEWLDAYSGILDIRLLGGYYPGSQYIRLILSGLTPANLRQGVVLGDAGHGQITGTLVPGKLNASGSTTIAAAASRQFTVNGLTFRPSKLRLSADAPFFSSYVNWGGAFDQNGATDPNFSSLTFNADGFTVTIETPSNTNTSFTLNWEAVE